uniref:Uncharacterized protein n=1 Tax=Arundo donax TaxID=35708 RepID=A0A0A9FFA8_ARUDO
MLMTAKCSCLLPCLHSRSATRGLQFCSKYTLLICAESTFLPDRSKQ